MSWSDTIQNVLTKGIDAAQSVETARIAANDPTPNTYGVNGYGGTSGQGVFAGTGGMSPILLIGGGLALVLVVVLLVKKL
jgi:hypothetical protein